ncbi:MarR family transcriptional regulator [bacterium LRH843]|nr:MarR family transcriptional regulator [bacterium LRH843]
MNPILHEVFQCSRYLTKELNLVLKEFDLYASQWSVLYCVSHRKQMKLTDIWTYLNVEAPTVTRTANRLVELGWLTIMPAQDRREKIVTLSEEAVLKFPEIETAIIRYTNRFLKGLTVAEQEQLSVLLRKLQQGGE